MTALSVEDFEKLLGYLVDTTVDRALQASTLERRAAQMSAYERCASAYTRLHSECDEWAHLKDAIGRDLGAALGRIAKLERERDEARGALDAIAQHQRIVAGEMGRRSVTLAIAERALCKGSDGGGT
jgi:hypothetical protein